MKKILKAPVLLILTSILIIGCNGVAAEKSADQKTSENSASRQSHSKTIFMIHGMWCGPWVWDNYKAYFEKKGYRCVTTTLRFHDMDPGDTPNPELGTTSLNDYAEDLEREIRALDEKPIIMGHSMGGLLAQKLGTKDLAESLVLLTPASPSGIMALESSVIKSFWNVLTTWGFWREPMRLSYEDSVYAMLHLLPPDRQKEVYDKLVYESGCAAYEIGFWLLDSDDASAVDEEKMTCPVLVIAASEDRLTPASVVKKVADKYDSVSTYKEFEDHAHWVLGEPNWKNIAEYIDQWLEKKI